MNARINTLSNQFNLNFKFRPKTIKLIMRTMFIVCVCLCYCFPLFAFPQYIRRGTKTTLKTDSKKRPRQHKRQEAPQSRLEGCVRDGRHGSPCAPRSQQTFLIFSLAVVKLESVFSRYAHLKMEPTTVKHS